MEELEPFDCSAIAIEEGLLVILRYGGWDVATYRVAEGGKMFWKFLEPGFLKQCRGELL